MVGGGVLGTMHAWQALERGHEVVQVEREAEARGASVRNFGMVWVSGRADGPELATALRARELWQLLGERAPDLGFRGNGSLTVLRTDAEVAVAEQTAARDTGRGLALLDPARARAVNPALGGDFLAALHCPRDAVVEPRTAQPVLRALLAATGRYTWLPGREVRELADRGARDDHGDWHDADLVLLCTGAALGGLVRELAGPTPVRRVRLQMMQTESADLGCATSVADGDSLRYYPAYRGAALDELNRAQPQPEVPREHRMQLLIAPRRDGGLTIGDTHEYTEPFGFDTVEEPYHHLRGVAEALLGRPLPPVRHRWAGVYAQCVDTGRVVHRQRVADRAWLVTGPGGRGMTCAPAIAEATAEEVGL